MDVNVQAYRLVQDATSEDRKPSSKKVQARKGGLKGGPARAKSISPEKRSLIARRASLARWGAEQREVL